MKALNLNTLIFYLFVFSFVFLLGCSNVIEIQSTRRTDDIKIDGDNAEWKTPSIPLKDVQMSFRICNDDQYVYLCLVTSDRQKAAQIFMTGLTLWFDNKGGKDETFGIHFPIRRENNMRQETMMDDSWRNGEEDIEKNRRERQLEMMKESIKEVEILGPGKDDRERILVDQLKGIKIGMRNIENTLVYELAVPLKKSKDNPYAVEADAINPIGIGIKSGKFNQERMRGSGERPQGGGGNMPPMGGGGGRSRMGGGRGQRGERPEQPKEIDVWLKVTLR
jgi:hypothetical protein